MYQVKYLPANGFMFTNYFRVGGAVVGGWTVNELTAVALKVASAGGDLLCHLTMCPVVGNQFSAAGMMAFEARLEGCDLFVEDGSMLAVRTLNDAPTRLEARVNRIDLTGYVTKKLGDRRFRIMYRAGLDWGFTQIRLAKDDGSLDKIGRDVPVRFKGRFERLCGPDVPSTSMVPEIVARSWTPAKPAPKRSVVVLPHRR
jgi:hypothetical protein